MRALITATVIVMLATPAFARRVPGTWSDANLGGVEKKLRFIGRFDPSTGTVQGRIRCKRCPLKGPFNPTCTGDSTTWNCEGPAGPAGSCTASGYVYPNVFEGTWQCGAAVGNLSFGRR